MPTKNLRRKTPKVRCAKELTCQRQRNERVGKKQRQLKRYAMSAASVCQNGSALRGAKFWQWRVGWFGRFLAIIFLLPACVLTVLAFFAMFRESMQDSLWRTPPFWFFTLGLVMWLVNFFWLWRPIYLYVLGHEATHALFTYVSFGWVVEFRVSKTGGHVLTTKNNLLISLSPYFFPIYAALAALLFWLLGRCVDLAAWREVNFALIRGFRWEWLGFWLIGVTWGFHATFTAWMIWKDQPDLRNNGTFFSLNLIVLANVLLLAALLIFAMPGTMSWSKFADEWLHAGRTCLEGLKRILVSMRVNY